MIRHTSLVKSLIALALATVSTAQAQLISPQVESDYQVRMQNLSSRKEFSGQFAFPKSLTDQQRECMEMLYAYMPLSDMVDRDVDYYLDYVVNPALQAREEMPWGNKISPLMFRHFVLPVRVNNEALDRHRPEFYAELKDRVKGLSMEDAILEVNHWCHEKATYQPSDGRTHSPLQTVSSAIGRCGEESTFAVAALRAVGIPARQVYTPRWAHTDDNHAWVEAWANGKWYFLGACEPEPILNLGWFNEPASRGMMMHARVFGRYDGPEEVTKRYDGNTDINVTENYAPVSTLTATVLDRDGNPVEGANVDFRVYNYSEFYPVVTKATDKNGQTTFTGGQGDIIVWASNNGDYDFAKVSNGKDKNVQLRLTPANQTRKPADYHIVPPPVSPNLVKPTTEQKAANDLRFAHEDSIRRAYMATFFTPEQSDKLADQLGIDSNRLRPIMIKSRGNHAEIEKFLKYRDDNGSMPTELRMQLLESLADKDLSDIPAELLIYYLSPGNDNPYKDKAVTSNPLFVYYTLCPRVDNEELTPSRWELRKNHSPEQLKAFRDNPALLAKWITENIDATQAWYPEQATMSPASVDRYRLTSAHSRDIYFVEMAHALGVPAQIDYITGKVQWAGADGKWNDVNFETTKEDATLSSAPKGKIQLICNPSSIVSDPKYYTHFTLSKITDGQPVLQNYPEAPWSQLFKEPTDIDAGQYLLITGQRLADGSVLAHTKVIDIEEGKLTVDTLTVREDDAEIQVIGSFNSEDLYQPVDGGLPKSILSTTGRGYYVLGLLRANEEPSNHTLRDIAAVADELEKTGRQIVLLYPSAGDVAKNEQAALRDLPSNVTFGGDIDHKILDEVRAQLHLSSEQTPIFIIADTFNRVVFVSQGYTIGLGQKLYDILTRLQK